MQKKFDRKADHQLVLEIWFLFLDSTKGQKRNKIKFVTKFVGIIVTIVFI